MIVIVDYGMGNLRSVQTRVEKLGFDARLSSVPEDIFRADKLILPGVGAFGTGMKNLWRLNLIEALNQRVLKDHTPVMGICLGMQLMTEWSEEGDQPGLGWFKARTVHFGFKEGESLRVPHMGWNTIEKKRDHPLLAEVPDHAEFYFVHSYYVECDNPEDVLATATYGREFAAVIHRANLYGTQFHPEKSHQSGANLLKAFLEL